MATSISTLITRELARQRETLDLIPSENIASPAVLKALGSCFTNKYAEGYPGKRYYPGNEIVDVLERRVQELVREVFSVDESYAVNVQPYSGSPANLAAYLGLLAIGDPLMGLSLASGGHLTHGHRASFTGKLFASTPYTTDPVSGLLDYGAIRTHAMAHHPRLIVAGTTAYPRSIDFKRFSAIARDAGSLLLADISHLAGLVAAGTHESPIGQADIVTFTTHKTLRGPRAAVIIAKTHLAERIDKAVFPGLQGGPHLNAIAAIGVALEEARRPAFRRYAERTVANAKALAGELLGLGWALLTGGTDTHLLVADLRPRGVSGSVAETLLERAGILANRNAIPGDDKPFDPSGLRMGTPSLTSRGMKPKDVQRVARIIHAVVSGALKPEVARTDVRRLARAFPLPYRA